MDIINKNTYYIERINLLEQIIDEKDILIRSLKDRIDSCESCSIKKIIQTQKKTYFEISATNRHRRFKQISDFLCAINHIFILMGITIFNIQLCKFSGENGIFNFSINENPILNQVESIKKALYYKDLLYISDKAYHIFIKSLNLQSSLPTIHYIRQYRRNQDALFHLKKVGSNAILIKNIGEAVKFHIVRFLNKYTSESFPHIVDEEILLMFSADGTLVGKVSQKINLTFSIINEIRESIHNKEKSRLGSVHTLGIIESSETYEALRIPFKYINDAFYKLENEGIIHNNKFYKIKFLFGADLSLAAKSQGLKSARSMNPCVYCTADQKNFHDCKQHEYNMIDNTNNHYIRTKERQNEMLKQREIRDKLGYDKFSLFESFSHDRYVTDTLHMMIRITNILMQRLTTDIQYLDKHNGKSKIDFKKHQRIARLFKFFECCNIKVQPIVDKQMLLRTLRGEECKRLLKNIQPELFTSLIDLGNEITDEEIKRYQSIEELWLDFNDIYNLVITNNIGVESLKVATQKWLEDYNKIYASDSVTVYMHIFSGHLADIFEKYGDVHSFNLQNLEKLNHITTLEWARATNHKDCQNEQILKRRLRIESYLYDFQTADLNDIITELSESQDDADFSFDEDFSDISDISDSDMSDSVNDTSINDKSKRLDDSVQEEMEIQNNTTFRTIEIKDCDFVKESDWLKSSQIAFWLQEYRKQFPNVLGLDHPSLYSFRDFKPIFDSNRLFIQVVLVNNCHWICLSNYLCKSVSEINIYDSLNTFTKQEKLNTLKAYFKMLFPDKQNIIVNVKNVQKQENGNDCGLFSLAFTQMICLNKDPTQLKFYSKHFRQHFNACLKENSISEFPSVYKKNETHDKKNYYISLNDIL